MDTEQKYFVFQKGLDLPIYIRYREDEFHPNLGLFLNSLRFTELSDEDIEKAFRTKKVDSRILDIKLSNAPTAQQIKFATESDTYGSESIIIKNRHKVYRYKEVALILYSFGLGEWVLGCFKDFGVNKQQTAACKCIIYRYLSWALAPMGIVGFWGHVSDEKAFILRQRESIGNVFFIDLLRNRILDSSGFHPLREGLTIFRQDHTLGLGKTIRMGREQLISFLTQYTSYLDYSGPSLPLKHSIQKMAQRFTGVICPRKDLPLEADFQENALE